MIGTREAAERKGVSLRRIQQLITSGVLPASKVGRDYVIIEQDLDKLTVHGKAGRPKKIKSN